VGGFTTAGNVNTIFANLLSNVGGYEDNFTGTGNALYVVVENTDMVGITIAGATNGYNSADSVIKNGQVG